MKFEKYPSLIRSDELAKGKLRKYTDGIEYDFYATEKIHGCNFAIYYDGNDIKLAKRTDFIQEGEQFYRYEEYFTNYDFSHVKAIFENHTYSHVIIYGEFFGGEIQENVQYEQTVNDTKEFKVFNVFGKKADNLYDVFGYEEMAACFPEGSVAPFIAKGKLWDLLKNLNMDAPSTFGGISEGYVLQPYDRREFSNGDTFLSIKHKTHHFTEVTPAKLNDLIGRAATVEDLKRYITINRFYNLLSHGHENSLKNVGGLIEVFLDDIFKEYEGEAIPEKDVVGYRNQLKPLVGRLIYENVDKNTDSGFSKD